jgi:ribosome-binding protein aMBF1 (putative translation factor)
MNNIEQYKNMSLKSLKENLLKNENFSKEYFDRKNMALAVAEMVRNERMKNGLTQRDLAKLLNTKQSSIARLERGSSSPSLSFLEKIAGVLKVKLVPPQFVSISKKTGGKINLVNKIKIEARV